MMKAAHSLTQPEKGLLEIKGMVEAGRGDVSVGQPPDNKSHYACCGFLPLGFLKA